MAGNSFNNQGRIAGGKSGGSSVRARRNAARFAVQGEYMVNPPVIITNDGRVGLDLLVTGGLIITDGQLGINLATDPGLEIISNALRVKIKTAGGIIRDSDGLSVDPILSTVVIITTTSFTAADDEIILVDDDTAGGVVTITLPAISGITGKIYIIKKIGNTANVIIDGNASETIDGATTVTILNQYDTITVVAGTTEWSIV